MKNLPLLIFVTALILSGSPAFSQQNRSSIHFEAGQHNFGRINEEDGPVQHDFIFTNRGEDPLIVTNVRAGGGISIVGWTRSPVMPGEPGSVTVEFNPQNMPGRFNRTIAVNATGNPSAIILRLLGEVVPRDKTPEEMYPHQAGLLRMRTNHISFGNVTPGSAKEDSLEVINLSNEELNITFTAVPWHVTLEAVPQKLSPGQKGVIRAAWDAGRVDDWGVITHSLRISVNGANPGRNILYLSANIQEDFSGMSEKEREDAPSLSFEERVLISAL